MVKGLKKVIWNAVERIRLSRVVSYGQSKNYEELIFSRLLKRMEKEPQKEQAKLKGLSSFVLQ